MYLTLIVKCSFINWPLILYLYCRVYMFVRELWVIAAGPLVNWLKRGKPSITQRLTLKWLNHWPDCRPEYFYVTFPQSNMLAVAALHHALGISTDFVYMLNTSPECSARSDGFLDWSADCGVKWWKVIWLRTQLDGSSGTTWVSSLWPGTSCG